MATAEELDNDENVPEGGRLEQYTSLSVYPTSVKGQTTALSILQVAQAQLVQEGLPGMLHAGFLDDPVEVDGWIYDENRYNEDTLRKVHSATRDFVKSIAGLQDTDTVYVEAEKYATELIGQLQNAGILFREKLHTEED